MSDLTPAQGWKELLLALPEFVRLDADLEVHGMVGASISLPPLCGLEAARRLSTESLPAGILARLALVRTCRV